MHIFITGATGLIGSHLCPLLLASHQLTVLSRDPAKATLLLGSAITAIDSLDKIDFNTVDCVINLAGEAIINKRWSDKQKQRLLDSRIQLTQQISTAIQHSQTPPHTFISGSAIGFYGRQDNTPIDESFTAVTPEFSHKLCAQWEQAAYAAQSANTRVCTLRTGIVLAKQAGALAKMLPPFKFGLGGPIGSSEQGMSWIHIDDMVQLILFVLVTMELSGPINATAPNPVSNKEFSRQLGKALARPAVIPMPSFILKLAMGEMADLLLYGQFVVPNKVLAQQFSFNYPTLPKALENLLT
ncbi:MAG: TIGR01777 family oxidoreductase [Pseudoalteromonas prydzensis]|uniref:TIGR01777 family oxidoreductase n=1 Tax=Pseudoalteromonas prydzensis TaxID=182141 RepID=UPI003F9D9DF5